MWARMSSNNGYIIKLYKKIKNLNQGNSDFDFVSFMNFDGIKIFPVNGFSDYQKKTITFSSPAEYDKDCSRQKLFIYGFDENYSNLRNEEDIFDTRDNPFSRKYPILAVSIINLKRTADKMESIKEIHSILQKKNLKYKIFGSLSINHLVVIYRTMTFSDLFNCNIYSLYPNADNIHSSYTIPCLLLSCAKYWKEKDELEISIRASILPQNKYYNIKIPHKILLNGKRVYGLKKVKKYNLFGKYDLDIRGFIDSSEEFVENFNSGLFSQLNSEESDLVRNTNTRFLHSCKKNIVESVAFYPDKINTSIIEFQKNVSQLSNSIISAQSNSSDFNQNLARLWLRSYQLLIRGRNNPMLDDLCLIIENYFNLANKLIDDFDYSESIILGLKSLNTLIDNRELNDSYEFENPHSNLMFSGCNTALLSAYSNVAKKAFAVIKRMNKENKDYVSYITCDGYAEVSAREMFVGNDECHFINIRIPTELMFDFKNLICFILHEIGHNWNCLNDKDDELLAMFLETSLKHHLIVHKSQKDASTNEEVRAIKEYVLSALSGESQLSEDLYNAVSLALFQNQNIQNLKEAHSLAKKIIHNIRDFDSALEEALADIFMIKFIGIASEEVYLNLVVDYLKYKNIRFDLPEFKENNYLFTVFVRVAIVLIFLNSDDKNEPMLTLKKVTEKIERYINKSTDSIKSDFGHFLLVNMCDSTGEATNLYTYAHRFYKCAILVEQDPKEFRKKFVFDDNSEGLCIQSSFEHYLNARNDCDGFKTIINFIDNINAI